MDISFKRIEGTHFILSTIYGSSAFKIVSVFAIFGLIWQTEVVPSSSCVTVMAACYEPLEADQKKTKSVLMNTPKETEPNTAVKRTVYAGLAITATATTFTEIL